MKEDCEKCFFMKTKRVLKRVSPEGFARRFRISRRPGLAPFVGGEVTWEPHDSVTGTDGWGVSIQAALPRAEASASRGARVIHVSVFFLVFFRVRGNPLTA